MALQIEDPGLHTTVQDLGRPGHYHIGVPLGGAMDTLIPRVANHLVKRQFTGIPRMHLHWTAIRCYRSYHHGCDRRHDGGDRERSVNSAVDRHRTGRRRYRGQRLHYGGV